MIVLAGDMGAGKTAFAKGFGAAMGVTDTITSPTFTLINSYDCGKLTLHHADLYRLERTAEIADLAIAELAEFGGVVLVEWGDVAAASFGDFLEVRLDLPDDIDDVDEGDAGEDEDSVLDSRIIEIEATGPSWAGRWDRLTASLQEFR